MQSARIKVAVCCAVLAASLSQGALHAQSKPLRIGMTLSDIPLTTGQPDAGGEGYRYMGYTLYDSLINWKLDDPRIAPTSRGTSDRRSITSAETPSPPSSSAAASAFGTMAPRAQIVMSSPARRRPGGFIPTR